MSGQSGAPLPECGCGIQGFRHGRRKDWLRHLYPRYSITPRARNRPSVSNGAMTDALVLVIRPSNSDEYPTGGLSQTVLQEVDFKSALERL